MEKIGDLAEEPEWVSNSKVTWIDVKNPTRGKLKVLEAHYSFHELNIDDCFSKIQIPKVDSYESQVFAILHFPTIDREQSVPKSTQLAIFAGPDYLITVQQDGLKPVSEMFQICKTNIVQRDSLMGNSPGYLLHRIIDMLVDDLLHILIKVEGNLDGIEDLVFDEKTAVAKEISMLRREITALRRIVYPLKRTVLAISKEIQRFSEEDLSPYFDDVSDHIDKAIEAVDESKETIDIFKDTDFMLSTEKSNKILAVLTILFTLSIPATVIAAYYGMNVNFPGGNETGSTIFLGPYTTFIIVIISSSVPVAIMMYWFKRQEWLSF
ncbi:MAG TPA: magnesium transporter CorA family protein [Nitrososphaeraceae archaeon]|nr:magnesium transporter CorA family protein [Nitrososphaeraceae archaeon]